MVSCIRANFSSGYKHALRRGWMDGGWGDGWGVGRAPAVGHLEQRLLQRRVDRILQVHA